MSEPPEGPSGCLRSVGPEPEQVAQAVQPVRTEELVEQPTERVHAVGGVVVLGLPRAVLDLVQDPAAWSTGTAKPMPSLPPEALAMAVLMPIARPSRSASGPPELPELIAASVWIRSCSSPIGVGTVRPSALTMPVVTVWLRPNGLPTAIVISPTCTSARAPRANGFRSDAAPSSARMTAVSMDLSTATTAPEMLVPSWSRSVTESDRPTTCDAVRMRPPSAATNPEPTRAAGLDLHDRGQEPRGRVRERLIARRDRRGRLVRLGRATGRGERRQQRPEMVAGGEHPGADEDDGPDQEGGADDEPASGPPRGSGGGHRRRRQHRPSRSRMRVLWWARRGVGSAAGRASSCADARRRRRDRPREWASGSGAVACRSDRYRSGQ